MRPSSILFVILLLGGVWYLYTQQQQQQKEKLLSPTNPNPNPLLHRGSATAASGTAMAPASQAFVGCYHDKAERALPVALGTEVTLVQCRELARSRGLPLAGMQSQNSHQHQLGQCWGGHDGTQYGPGGACQNTPDGNKIGGAWTNALYRTL
jgi:hypothetical protein